MFIEASMTVAILTIGETGGIYDCFKIFKSLTNKKCKKKLKIITLGKIYSHIS